jgi:hypothetical protein
MPQKIVSVIISVWLTAIPFYLFLAVAGRMIVGAPVTVVVS